MTPDQMQHVRTSFALLVPIADQAADLFYANLFKADPSLRALFKAPLQEQGRKLMQMIGVAVGLLDKQHVLLPALRQLGTRHAGYGVAAQHYTTVGTALLQTLEQGLGPAFDAPTEQAWIALYTLVSATMLEAAEAPAQMPA